jgi:hypothetical protein
MTASNTGGSMKRVALALSILLAALPLFAREGFGFKKKAVDMVRTIPPSTNAGARRVKVTVTSDRDDARDDAQTLSRLITEAILGGAGTLAEGARAEVEIDVSLDRLESHESWETETTYVQQQTGTKQKWNEKKKKMETEPIYSSVPVQKQVKVMTGNLTGSFEIASKNGDVASGSIDRDFRRKYGDYDTAPAPTEIEDDLMKQAANAIVAYLVPTRDRVSVLVPRASFEALIPLAESGEWQKYLAAVEAVPPRKGPQDEAYRQYALAIAKEALAYETEDRKETLELLRAATSHYEVAVATNPGEELFRKGYTSLLSASDIGAPADRAKASLAKFETWVTGSGSAPAIRVASTAPVAPASKSAVAKQGMRNQTVVDLAKAGLSDENIILAIDAANATAFDVTPDGLIALAQGGVSKAVIAHMQKKSRR